MGLRLGQNSRRIPWRAVVLTGVLLGCLVPVVLVYRFFYVCAGPSAAALKEVPAYGGARLTPIPNPIGSPEDCSDRISTTDDTDRIVAYYREHLVANGWALLPEDTETNESMTNRAVMGVRGGLCYRAAVEHYRGGDPPETKQLYVSGGNPSMCQRPNPFEPLAEPP